MERGRNIVGRQLAKLRYQRGLSQAAVAARLNRFGWEDATRFLVAKIEASSRCVTDKEAVLLAKALKAPVIELFPPSAR